MGFSLHRVANKKPHKLDNLVMLRYSLFLVELAAKVCYSLGAVGK